MRSRLRGTALTLLLAGLLVGGVDFEGAAARSSFITPVPGGVGAMTVTALMLNTLKAAKGEIYPKG